MKYKRTLALDSDGDLRVENGNLVWLEGVAAVEQELKTTLLTVRGEDPFDEDHGLDIFEISSSPEAIIEREIRAALLEDDRVSSIDEIDIEEPSVDRRTEVTIQVSLVDGTGLGFSAEV